MKRCHKCGNEKPADEWGKHPTWCLACLRAAAVARNRARGVQARHYPIAEKVCPACGELKPRAAFGEKGGFIRDRCRPCAAAQQRSRRAADPEKKREIKRRHYHRHPEAHKAAAAEWAKTERGRMVGRMAMRVRRALQRGTLVRLEACEFCGVSCVPQAAHEDYSRPLDVRWLCRKCHARWDYERPKSLMCDGCLIRLRDPSSNAVCTCCDLPPVGIGRFLYGEV